MISYLLCSIIVRREDEWWSITPSLGKLGKNMTMLENGTAKQNQQTFLLSILHLPLPNLFEAQGETVWSWISDFKTFSHFYKRGKSNLCCFLGSSPHKQGMLNRISVRIALKHREGFLQKWVAACFPFRQGQALSLFVSCLHWDTAYF